MKSKACVLTRGEQPKAWWKSIVAVSALLFAIWLPATSVLGQEFSQFRGSQAGFLEAQPIPLNWSESENVAWKVPLSGSGWSQPVIWQDRLYITSAESSDDLRPKNFADGAKMPQSMGLGSFTNAPRVTIQWQVQCYDVATGKQLWAQTACNGNPKHPVHPSNTYATETPVVDSQGVTAFFGATGVLANFDHNGSKRWQADLGVFASDNGFGTGSSIATYRGKVFVQHFTKGSGTVAAYDTETGEQRWKFERPTKGSSWSSPLVWINQTRAELIVAGGDRLESLDPDSGTVLWNLGKVKAPTACSIAADRKRIYFGGSDPFSKGPLFAMSAGASGDLSPKKMNDNFDHCDWLEAKAGPGMPSPVSNGEFVYVVDSNILRAYDANSGKRTYQTRIPQVNQVAASPLVVGDKLLVLDESGQAAIIQTGSEFSLAGSGKLDDTFWATPAVSAGSIFLRGVNSLYCLRQKQ